MKPLEIIELTGAISIGIAFIGMAIGICVAVYNLLIGDYQNLKDQEKR